MSLAAQEPLPPEWFVETLQRLGPSFPISPDPSSTFRLIAIYLAELDLWRRRVNLTGDLSPEELVAHCLESALGSNLIANGKRVVDVGSGAGFPGLPLAIARQDLSVTLVEPRQKRAVFLRHAVRAIGLSNTAVFQGRIEDVGGQTFCIATTRAVGSLPIWLGNASFLSPEGILLAWTTEPDRLASELLQVFTPRERLVIPGSSFRQIAAFRKR